MRIEHTYGQRSAAEKRDPKVRYFIACEGSKTEYQYFDGIVQNRNYIGINSLVEIVPVEHESANSENHPLKLYEAARKAIDKCDNYFPNSGDRFCLIVDRDKNSFIERQYDELLSYVHAGKVSLFVSNPCFEFWLLLHFGDCKDYDQQKLLDNKKSGKKTYTEQLLGKCLGGSYNKVRLKYKFNNYFKDRVKTAVNNAELHAVELEHLKNSIGTNVGRLIKMMLNNRQREDDISRKDQ